MGFYLNKIKVFTVTNNEVHFCVHLLPTSCDCIFKRGIRERAQLCGQLHMLTDMLMPMIMLTDMIMNMLTSMFTCTNQNRQRSQESSQRQLTCGGRQLSQPYSSVRLLLPSSTWCR